MPNVRRNLDALRDLIEPIKKSAAVEAIEAGQEILMNGMVSRVPRRTGRLARSIYKTRVRTGPRFATGSVLATARHSVVVNYGSMYIRPQPFVDDTRRQDGPRAEDAMARIIEKRLR